MNSFLDKQKGEYDKIEGSMHGMCFWELFDGPSVEAWALLCLGSPKGPGSALGGV